MTLYKLDLVASTAIIDWYNDLISDEDARMMYGTAIQDRAREFVNWLIKNQEQKDVELSSSDEEEDDDSEDDDDNNNEDDDEFDKETDYGQGEVEGINGNLYISHDHDKSSVDSGVSICEVFTHSSLEKKRVTFQMEENTDSI